MAKKSRKDVQKELVEKFSAAVIEASQTYGKSPALVTSAEYNEFTELSEWELRKIGGFNNLKKVVFPFDDQDLAAIRENQRMKSYISKLERELGDKQSFEKNILNNIEHWTKTAVKNKIKLPKVNVSEGKKMTMELMLSDIHYGKKTETFDLETCRKRMKQLTNVFLEEVAQKEKTFNVETLIIAILGDIIESFSMHGLESAIGCEFSNSRQIQEAIDSLFWDSIAPIAMTGKKIIVPCVTGNHDRTETGRTMYKPGETNVTWIIYNMLDRLAKAHSLSNVEFIIPKESFCVIDIYGSNVLYEHGDNIQKVEKRTILGHMADRGRQIKKQIHMARFGHYHEYVCFDRGRAIINESVCGQDSYAEVKGFASTSGQTINFYVETENRPSSFYYSFPVYLG